MPVTGDLFLQLISIRTNGLLRDVAVLDAYFFLFLLSGIALLYLTLPRPLVVRPPGDRSQHGSGAPPLNGRTPRRRPGTVIFDRQDSLGHAIRTPDGEVAPAAQYHDGEFAQHGRPAYGSFTMPGGV